MMHPEGSRFEDTGYHRLLETSPSFQYGRFQLVFRHTCLSHGCLDTRCQLCEHNQQRTCTSNIPSKIYAFDVLKAKCGATIWVEAIDGDSGAPIPVSFQVEVLVLNGARFDEKYGKSGPISEADMEACILPCNQMRGPLLVSKGSNMGNGSGKAVVMELQDGVVSLPEMHFSDTSEALLKGRRPPFRLLVRAVAANAGGRQAYAVSEPFVVTTRRTKLDGKDEIPSISDPVKKLQHLGKRMAWKLQDINATAADAGSGLRLPKSCNYIITVADFRKLVKLVEAEHGSFLPELIKVLGIGSKKWDEVRENAMRAVEPDSRLRIWFGEEGSGLLFDCNSASIRLDCPIGLLQKKFTVGLQTTVEATLAAQLSPGQRALVEELQMKAIMAWWTPGHPGWCIWETEGSKDAFLRPSSAFEDPGSPISSGSIAGPASDDAWGCESVSQDEAETGTSLPNGKRHLSAPGVLTRHSAHQMSPKKRHCHRPSSGDFSATSPDSDSSASNVS